MISIKKNRKYFEEKIGVNDEIRICVIITLIGK